MVFLHRPEHHRLLGTGRSICRCPRPWLINRTRDDAHTTHPWFVLLRVEPDGGYRLLVRTRTHEAAIRMVYALIRFDKSFANNREFETT